MTRMTRREALATAGAAAVGSTLGAAGASAQTQEKAVKKGRLKQSVCRWCYERIPLEEFCRGVAAIGLDRRSISCSPRSGRSRRSTG